MQNSFPSSGGGLSCVAALAIALLAGCPFDPACEREACGAVEVPRGRGAIDRGITGVIASSSDVCNNGCCECTYADAELSVWRTEQEITSAAEARSVMDEGPATRIISAHQRYEQPLDAGDYLVCHGGFCAAVHLGDRDVFTVNIKQRYGPPSLFVFGPGDDEPRDELVFRTEPQ